jgi:predicted RNA-binding Zn-ribbon protein involved in translation (DUF1610 family)
MIPILRSIHHWYCPNCGKTDVTNEPRPHSRFHVCPKLRGLTAPMLPAGTQAKVEAIERQDYVGTERVQLDPERGRPVQSVVTTRDNGQDCIVFAPVATGTGSAG